MPTTHRNLLRCTIQVATWILLLVVAFGSRSQFGVCTAESCCSAADGPSTCSCCGCCTATPPPPADRTPASTTEDTAPALQARGCTDCRLELSLPLQPAPLPRPVHAPDLEPSAISWFGVDADQHPVAAEPCPCPFDTGPPRPDRRTVLLATTILRR